MGRRYRRYRRKSTGIIRMKFQSFMDISTSSESMQIITISAGGPDILRRLAPQFSAYKYYRISNVSAKFVPASTLPVDPTGLSYTAGDNLVDPRDQLTPGMMRITNGEDIFENISGLSDAEQHQIYNTMLLDPRWFKWMLQSGVKRHATPRYWQIGQLHQDKWPGAFVNLPNPSSESGVNGTSFIAHTQAGDVEETAVVTGQSSQYGFFQTGHRGVLGWLPTDGLAKYFNGSTAIEQVPLITSPPEVEVMKVILPKAYKTRYYYRVFITETVLFREPIVNFGIVNDSGFAMRPLDVFHVPDGALPVLPNALVTPRHADPQYTGGNYGDN